MASTTLTFPQPDPAVRDNLGGALKGRRHDVMIAGHLRVVVENGQHTPHRDKALCVEFFHDLLVRLQTDYVDVLMLHCVDEPGDFEVWKVVKNGDTYKFERVKVISL